MKKRLWSLFCCVLLVGVFGAAHGQFDKPESAVKYRQAVMFLMSQHFGRMAAMVNKKNAYDQEAFAYNAMIVETLSRLPWQAFMVPGTDKGDTALKPAAFEQPAKFNEIAQTLAKQTGELAGIAKSGDFDAIKAQFGEVGKTCKACHSQFRAQ